MSEELKSRILDYDLFSDFYEFQDIILSGIKEGKKYCFILGAGASTSSGIPSGRTMVDEWFDDLKKGKNPKEFETDINKRIKNIVKDYDSAKKAEETEKLRKYTDYNYIPDIRDSQDDYNYIYSLRFAYDDGEGQQYILKKSDEAFPNIGYISLASIICNCPEANIVITTNFDELVDFSVTYYQSKHPFCIEHERMADYALENITGRPKILKLHRGVAYGGLNKADETKELDERWKNALKELFKDYIPIVVGYSGTDKDIMQALYESNYETIYWCHRFGSIPNFKVQKLIEQKKGKMVAIHSFDQLFCDIESIFIEHNKANVFRVYDDFSDFRNSSQLYNKTNATLDNLNNKFKKNAKAIIKKVFKKREPDWRRIVTFVYYIAFRVDSLKICELILSKEAKKGNFYTRGYLELAKAFFRKGKYEKSEQTLNIIINNPTSSNYMKAQAYRILYDILSLRGDSDIKRKETIKRAVELEPTHKKSLKVYNNLN